MEEIQLLKKVRVVVALGKLGFDTTLRLFTQLGEMNLSKRPQFAHAAEAQINPKVTLIASYHPSQQNTFTGRLTEPMFDAIFARAKELVSSN